jgi:DNA-binding response OmpR family regulator
MSIHALFLVGPSTQTDIVRLFTKHCARYEIASSFAQAAAIFSKSLDAGTSLPLIDLIVADVPAGGINLAEYVLGRIRPTAYFGNLEYTPKIVVFDKEGRVGSARRALQLGLDEYLLPADLTEVRVDALFKEWQLQPRSALNDPYTDSVDLDFVAEPVTNNRLSSVEAAIINCLSARPGEAVSARSLVQTIMGRDVDEDHAASLIRPHISRLRSKLEPTPQMPRKLLTVRGKGYIFVGE